MPSLPVQRPEGLHRLPEEEPRQGSATARRAPGSLTHLAMELFKQQSGTFMRARALPRHRAGLHRPAGRADADDVPGPRRGAAAHPLGPRAGRWPSPACSAIRLARRADLRGLATRASTACSGTASSAPPGMPAEIVKQLNERSTRRSPRPTCASSFAGEALEPMPMTPEQFGKYIQADIARWTKLAKERNIQLGGLKPAMARNTKVAADHNAPPDHADPREVRRHASVARLERRGRPRGAPHVPELGRLRGRRRAARGRRRPRWPRVQMLQPAPQASVLGRAEKVDMASAALVNGITLAHLRLRRHAPEDHHPSGGPGRLGRAGARRAPGATGAR